jgi:hypothetical protein
MALAAAQVFLSAVAVGAPEAVSTPTFDISHSIPLNEG